MIPWPTTILRMSPFCAPSAMRIPISCVRCAADDRLPGSALETPHLVSERVAVRPDVSRETLADNRHRLGIRAIALLEETPLDQRNSERLEIIRADHQFPGVVVRRRRPPLDSEVTRQAAASHRQTKGYRPRRLDTRQDADFFEHCVVERSHLRFVFILRLGQLQVHSQNVVRIETWVDLQ